MSQSILGIDLGTYSIKVLRLERRLQEIHLLEFFELPLNLHVRHQHHEQVAEVLEPFFKEHQFSADIICLNVPGHTLSNRILEIPFTNAKKIAQSIEFELEGHIPFPIEEVFWDYHVLSQGESSSQVLCAYAYEENI